MLEYLPALSTSHVERTNRMFRLLEKVRYKSADA
jgi:hypothetical protein